MGFKSATRKIKRFWGMADFRNSTILGLIFFVISVALNYKANVYVATKAGSGVGDVLLDILPVVNTEFFLIEGALVFILGVMYLMFRRPQRVPFILKSVALFVTIRAGFLVLTHFGPYPETLPVDLSGVLLWFSSGLDRFFSAHTGMPFFFALMFWSNFPLRIMFLLSSVIGAVSVLLAHVHYSIDVASAYFITYAIFHMAIEFFEKDFKVFEKGLQHS